MTSPYPLATDRLTVRIMRTGDAETLAAYRNDPAVAEYQSWDLPFTAQDAVALLAAQDRQEDLEPGAWTQLAVELDGAVIGDVCCRLEPTGGVAELGFSIATAFQGKGFATEAATALVEDLVERLGVHRVFGSLDPRNLASARVLGALGLTWESTTERSCPVRGEWADTTTYGGTAEDHRAWRDRPRREPRDVRLIELTAEVVAPYRRLATHHWQQRYVAPMLDSLADALFPEVVDGAPVVPVLFGVEADGEPAGFVMYADVTDHHPVPYLWRLLIDRRHQHRGIGARAVDILIARLHAAGHPALLTSWVEGPGGPEPFYLRRGFERTGRIVDGEIEGRVSCSR